MLLCVIVPCFPGPRPHAGALWNVRVRANGCLHDLQFTCLRGAYSIISIIFSESVVLAANCVNVAFFFFFRTSIDIYSGCIQ